MNLIWNTYRVEYASTFIVIISSFLIAIWPLPETIALRNVLILFGFAASVVYLYPKRGYFFTRFSWPIWAQLFFFIWLTLHLIYFSTEFDLQLHEYLSVWLRALGVTSLGFSLGVYLFELTQDNKKRELNFAIKLLIIGSSFTTILYSLAYLKESYLTGYFYHLNFYESIFREKQALIIYAGLIFFPITLIWMLKSIKGGCKNLLAPFILSSLVIFSIYFSYSKIGFFLVALNIILFLVLLSLQIYKENNKFSIVLIFSTLVFLSYGTVQNHLSVNDAWRNVLSDLRTASEYQDDGSQFWKNPIQSPVPKNDKGMVVGSIYLRSVWAHAGVRLLLERPLGYGLLNHSFGALLYLRWPLEAQHSSGVSKGSTHSGLLDIALGVGIPGVVFLFLPIFAAWKRASMIRNSWRLYIRWMIFFILLTYGFSEVGTSHYTETLLFLISFFSGLTYYGGFKN